MATTEKPMSNAEAKARIQESLRSIAASQTEMLRLLYNVGDPEEAKQFEEAQKKIQASLTEMPVEKLSDPLRGGYSRRRRARRRRHTRKF